MNSTKSWVSFDDELIQMNTMTSQQSDVRSSASSTENLDTLSSGSLDQLSFSMEEAERSRYSVFDSLRQRERNGEYLGWSTDILGCGEAGWSEGIRRTSL